MTIADLGKEWLSQYEVNNWNRYICIENIRGFENTFKYHINKAYYRNKD